MNLGEIRTDIRSLIVEPVPGFRSDEELNRWINQGHQELATMYQLETTVKIPLQPSTSFYALPDDFLTLTAAWDSAHNAISINPGLLGNDSESLGVGTTRETTISVYGQRILVTPAPTQPDQVDTLTLFYTRSAKQLAADNDLPEIPERYHRYLVAFGAMRALEKDEAFDESAVYEAEYKLGQGLVQERKSINLEDLNTVLSLVDRNVYNPAEAAYALNLPLKKHVWNRVEVEGKALNLLGLDVISRDDLIKNTVFPDREDIAKRLVTSSEEIASMAPFWGDDIPNG